jgi:hypothetical protein
MTTFISVYLEEGGEMRNSSCLASDNVGGLENEGPLKQKKKKKRSVY